MVRRLCGRIGRWNRQMSTISSEFFHQLLATRLKLLFVRLEAFRFEQLIRRGRMKIGTEALQVVVAYEH